MKKTLAAAFLCLIAASGGRVGGAHAGGESKGGANGEHLNGGNGETSGVLAGESRNNAVEAGNRFATKSLDSLAPNGEAKQSKVADLAHFRNVKQVVREMVAQHVPPDKWQSYLHDHNLNLTPTETAMWLRTAHKRFQFEQEHTPGASSGGGKADATLMGVNTALAADAAENSPSARNYALSGRAFLDAKQYGRSLDYYRRSLKMNPNQPKAWTGYGRSAYEMKDYELAAAAAGVALKLDPADRSARALYEFSKDRTSPVHLASDLKDPFDGSSVQAALAAGLNTGLGRPAAAANSGSGPAPAATPQTAAEIAAAASAPVAPDAAAKSAQFARDAAGALKIRDYPTAYQLASEAISADPRNAQALNYRAMTLTQMRRYSDAVQDASAALTLAPRNAAALYTRSWAFAKQGKYKEALQDADQSLETNPDNAFAYQTRAYALAGLGDRNGAIDSLRRSAAIDPRFTERLQRAVQMPQDADMTLLFDDGASARQAASAPAPLTPAEKRSRFLRLFAMAASGGLLIALGVLNVVSASWRDRMRMTVRRALGGAAPASGGADAPDLGSMTGAFWTQYQVVKEIGLGGMGVVYEALDRSLERRVAVKKMRDEIRLDPADRARFVNEARLVAQLHHPNIVDIYAIVEDEGEVYLVFEFVEGRTLQDALKSGGPMDLPKARRVLGEMAAAVAHAHEKGIIHRDLKPSNAMLTPEGRVKVMDFGVARQAKDALTRHSMMTNTVVGTPPYMAPEQEQGTVRRESDVYALGVCLYEMVTGQLPFTGSGAAMLLNKLNGKLIPPSRRSPGLPAGLDEVVARALAPDPDKRYRTPAELMAALDALLSSGRPA